MQLDNLESYATSDCYDDLERLVLRYAEEYLKEGKASSQVVADLSKHYSVEQMVELNVAIGIVNLVNHFIETFQIEIEADH